MKKILFIITMITFSMLSFSQANYGEFALPHTTDLATLNQYLGQKVKVMHYNGFDGFSSSNGHDEYIFNKYQKGIIDMEYTIQKIKVGSQIVFELVDGSGSKIKAKVNANREYNYKGMQSCTSFFLVDKFENANKNISGTKIKNSEGKEVATIEKYCMTPAAKGYPVLEVKVRSDLDNSTITCDTQDYERLCRNIGIR